MIDYSQFPGLAGVYLEDSYVLGISEVPGQLTFDLDAVLTPGSPDRTFAPAARSGAASA